MRVRMTLWHGTEWVKRISIEKMVFNKNYRNRDKKSKVPVPLCQDASHHTMEQKYGSSRVARWSASGVSRETHLDGDDGG